MSLRRYEPPPRSISCLPQAPFFVINHDKSLSRDEKATLERVKKILTESTAKQGVAEFWGQLFVEISGKKYYVKSFGRGTKTN